MNRRRLLSAAHQCPAQQPASVNARAATVGGVVGLRGTRGVALARAEVMAFSGGGAIEDCAAQAPARSAANVSSHAGALRRRGPGLEVVIEQRGAEDDFRLIGQELPLARVGLVLFEPDG